DERLRSKGSEVVTRRRVEVWQSRARGEKARRIYDEQGELVAGDWTNADGSRSVYARGQAPLQQKIAPAGAELSDGTAWRLEPSAEIFTAIVGGETELDHAAVARRSAFYMITYRREPKAGAGGLAEATIVVNRGDLRAVEMTLLFRQGGEEREFHFTEL